MKNFNMPAIEDATFDEELILDQEFDSVDLDIDFHDYQIIVPTGPAPHAMF